MPDSSHGTNPATASMAGFRTVTVKSAPDGGVDLDALRAALGPRTAAVMLTNPSTLGLFERRIVDLLEATHAAGALAYMDGANMNAILGRFKPGAAGFDVMHYNLHKTFSTPHGGGGPGAGPVAVNARLAPFLPGPLVVRDEDGSYRLERPGERPTSIGRMRAYQGSTGVLVRAYAYIRTHGLVSAAALAAYLPGPVINVAVQVVLAAVALLWLRRVLHLGLLEEAFEIEIGDDVTCANCGRTTARHTFCGHCGISLHALPKRRDEPRP